MKRSERLNDMLLYLNDKDYFNLKDLMEKYQISKSTALRDIQSLEEIGMPIFSEQGRYGRYGILKNRLLSPIVFTIDEMYALYFAMLTLDNYQTTPFHLNVPDLKKKFMSCLSSEYKEMVQRMEKVFSLANLKHPYESPLLKKILESAIQNKVCLMTYKDKEYKVQFLNISSSFGQWYVTGYHFGSEKVQIFRCDRIQSLHPHEHFKAKNRDDFIAKGPQKEKDAIDFEVKISLQGVDLFYKEHYPSMNLCMEENFAWIRGYYNAREVEFIASYFLSYGVHVLEIKPAVLKEAVIQKLKKMTDYYNSLS